MYRRNLLSLMTCAALALIAVPSSAQDAMVIAPNGSVGIGTSTPDSRAKVDAQGDGETSIWGTTFADDVSSQFALRRARGTQASPQALQSVDILGAFSFRGWTGSGWTGSRGFLAVRADQNWSTTAQGTEMFFSTTPNGSTTPSVRMLIDNDGEVGIGTLSPVSRLHVSGGDVRVSGGSFIDDGTNLNVPDYVFEPDYALPALPEVERFIAREGHLPGVPSSEEIRQQGLDLSEFQMVLLRKVEELTLYTLAQQQEIDALRGHCEPGSVDD